VLAGTHPTLTSNLLAGEDHMAKRKPTTIPPFLEDRTAFGHYLSGLTDGEGSFVLTLQHVEKNKIGRVIFDLCLRADDIDILKKVQSFLGCGRLYFYSLNRSNPVVYFKVTKHPDIWNKIVPHFDAFPLRAKKRHDYTIWRAAISWWMSEFNGRNHHGRRYCHGAVKQWFPEHQAIFNEFIKQLKITRQYPTTEQPLQDIQSQPGESFPLYD
jgi:hypothetical protein